MKEDYPDPENKGWFKTMELLSLWLNKKSNSTIQNLNKTNLIIWILDVLKLSILFGVLVFLGAWFVNCIKEDPRNLPGLNEYRFWISIIPLAGVALFGFQVYMTFKRINKRVTEHKVQ